MPSVAITATPSTTAQPGRPSDVRGCGTSAVAWTSMRWPGRLCRPGSTGARTDPREGRIQPAAIRKCGFRRWRLLESIFVRTYALKASEIEKKWRVFDAEGQALGRLATQVAIALRGKDKPTYSPHLDMGDFVIVTNASKVKLTGQKAIQKLYRRHTG